MTDKRLFPFMKCIVIIGCSFLLTSAGHMAWTYHLLTLTTAAATDWLTLVAGYLLQALGIAVFGWLRFRRKQDERKWLCGTPVLYLVSLLPAVLSPSLPVAAAFGLLQSLLCGVLAGGYIFFLAEFTEETRRAKAFGFGYGAATVAAWLLSLMGDGWLLRGSGVWIICIPAAALTAAAVLLRTEEIPTEEAPPSAQSLPKQGVLLAGAVVLLFSLVQNLGFSFATADIQNGLSIEFSRLFYAIGLASAGIVSDKSRKYGAVCALAALVVPFLVLTLRGEAQPVTVLWSLGYFGFGFYAVYRVLLFADISKKENLLWLSGGGLLLGRVGDAVGAGLSVAFAGNEPVRVIAAALLFAASVFAFFRLLAVQYAPAARAKTERELFNEFAARHDLSAREREVLQLVLQNKRNPDIAGALFVSESTVKFHIHNLLKKTGCKTRVELCDLYLSHKQ